METKVIFRTRGTDGKPYVRVTDGLSYLEAVLHVDESEPINVSVMKGAAQAVDLIGEFFLMQTKFSLDLSSLEDCLTESEVF